MRRGSESKRPRVDGIDEDLVKVINRATSTSFSQKENQVDPEPTLIFSFCLGFYLFEFLFSLL